VKRFALGTVQWGTRYGIANRTGQAPRTEIKRMLDRATELGIDTLDTARAYGESEHLLGELTGGDARWRIVTKLDPYCVPDGASPSDASSIVTKSIEQSLDALRRERLEVLLLHRAAHRDAASGAVWSTLLELRSRGLIGDIGISVGTPDDAFQFLADPDVAVLQVPASLVDRRLEARAFFRLALEAKKEIHVRSIFLQGALLLDEQEIPKALSPLASVVRFLSSWARERSSTPRDALLAYAQQRLNATLVLGCESLRQLDENAESLRAPAWSDADLDALSGALPALPDEVLDPARWPRSVYKDGP